MLNYLDLLLLLLLALGAWRGYRLGFINLVAGWLSYLVAGLVAILYARPLAGALDQAWHLSARWGNWLAPLLPLSRPVLGQPLNAATARQLEVLLSDMPLPGLIKQSLLGSLEKGSGVTVGQALAGQLAFLGLELITLVIFFYGSLWLLRRLARWGTMGVNMTPSGLINRGLGLALGLFGQAFGLAVLVGILRSFLVLPALTTAPGFLALARQLYSSGIALQLGSFYDWLASLLHTLV